jgi:hypothetical protein
VGVSTTRGKVWRLAPDGTVLWVVSFPFISKMEALVELADSSIVVVGELGPNTYNSGFIARLTSDGTVMWSASHGIFAPYPFMDVDLYTDNTLLVGGWVQEQSVNSPSRAAIYRYDTSGVFLSYTKLDPWNDNEGSMVHSLQVRSDGAIHAVGASPAKFRSVLKMMTMAHSTRWPHLVPRTTSDGIDSSGNPKPWTGIYL